MVEKQIDEFAKAWILQRSLTLAKLINTTTMDAIRKALAEGFAEGESIQQLTKRIEGYFDGNARVRATMVSRTETLAASNEGALHRYELEGIDTSEIYTDGNPCAICVEGAGEYPTKDIHGVIPRHPNCMCVVLPVVK